MHKAIRPYRLINLQVFFPEYVLYYALVKSILEYALTVWNSITPTDANNPECIQQKFPSIFSLMFLIVNLLPSRN
jgi:hypothetical protein